MNKTDINEFSKLTAEAVKHVSDHEFCQHLQAILNSLVSFSNLFILEFRPDQNPQEIYSWLPQAKLSKYYQQNYFQLAYQLDPYFQLGKKQFSETFHPIRQIAPDRFFTSEYYKSYYRDAEMGDELGMLASSSNDSIMHLSIGRLNCEANFTKREIDRLNQHVSLIAELLRKHDEYKSSANQSSSKSVPMQQKIKDWCEAELNCLLTDRESEIAVLILQGHSSLSAGLTLDIATETVKVHRKNLYRKLRVGSQAEFFNKLSRLIIS